MLTTSKTRPLCSLVSVTTWWQKHDYFDTLKIVVRFRGKLLMRAFKQRIPFFRTLQTY